MKITFLLPALFTCNLVQAQAQPNVKEQDGVTLSYDIQKTGNDKKGDKYTILMKAQNRNNFDVYYTGGTTGTGGTSANDGFAQFIVKNTHGFLATNVSYLKAQQTDLFTDANKQLYKIEPGKIVTDNFTIRVKAGDYPVILTNFTTSLKPLGFFSLRNNRKDKFDNNSGSRHDRDNNDRNDSKNNNSMSAGDVISSGASLTSENGMYVMRLQKDGNLCVYRKKDHGAETFVWCSMTNDKNVRTLNMQSDGNLVLYTDSKKPVWSTNTMAYFNPKYSQARNKPVRLVLENNGQLNLVSSTGQVVWSAH